MLLEKCEKNLEDINFVQTNLIEKHFKRKVNLDRFTSSKSVDKSMIGSKRSENKLIHLIEIILTHHH
jgi:hypothetical protein